MRLIRLALALIAVSVSWAASANPAVNSNISGAIAGNVGAANVGATAVGGQAQARLETGLGSSSNLRSSNSSGKAGRAHSGSSPAGAMDESIPRGWLMALVAVLLIGHQLRRKHRFLRPQRFSDI